MVTPRLYTQLTAALAACTVSVGLLAAPPAAPVAYSDSVIRTQKYVDVLGLKKLHAEGLNGEGITIGLVDGHVDETVPELKGAKIQHKEYCDTLDVYNPDDYAHATAVASILVSPYYGWAPKATLINYGRPVGTNGGKDVPKDCKRKTTSGLLLNRMLNDKVDVVVMTVGTTFSADYVFGYALVRAADMGVPVIVSAGNDGLSPVVDNAHYNGVIAVGATDLTGKIADFTNRGEGLTLMAPGTNITMREAGQGRQLTRISPDQYGTSFSAPMVAGAMALAKQKWPNAHGNQLINSMIQNAGKSFAGWNKTYGWGNLNVWSMISTNPSPYPKDNPVLQKVKDNTPGPKQIADFRDGLLDADAVRANDEYIYRGNNQLAATDFPPERRKMGTSPRYSSLKDTPAPTTSPTPGTASASATPADDTPNSDGNGPLLWILTSLVSLGTAIAITAILITRHRNRN